LREHRPLPTANGLIQTSQKVYNGTHSWAHINSQMVTRCINVAVLQPKSTLAYHYELQLHWIKRGKDCLSVEGRPPRTCTLLRSCDLDVDHV